MSAAVSPTHIPYQAYKSKRSAKPASQQNHLVPNVSPPPSLSRPVSFVEPPPPLPQQINYESSFEKESEEKVLLLDPSPPPAAAEVVLPEPPPTPPAREAEEKRLPVIDFPPSAPAPSSSKSEAIPSSPPRTQQRRVSTFRHVPRSRLPSSPLAPNHSHSRNVSISSTISNVTGNQRNSLPPGFEFELPNDARSRMTSFSSTTTTEQRPPSSAPLPDLQPNASRYYDPLPVTPPPRTSSLLSPASPPPPFTSPSLQPSLSTSATAPRSRPTSMVITSPQPIAKAPSGSRPTSVIINSPPSSSSAANTRSSTPRPSAPYRPGFQPKGVYRPRTDEFMEYRRIALDGDPSSGMQKRVERTKLERRLEKLINLHFPPPGLSPPPPPPPNRRASSFFDFDMADIKRLSMSDAGSLWKGVLSSSTGGKDDIRANEQRITPWQEDSSVSKCPLCLASFHPITNRKHHCRLCGKIICSLPVKRPQRPAVCSLLFVVDPVSRKIEEVGEGVDYGVRKRRVSSISNVNALNQKPPEDEAEKFLKGVRICRECRPVLLRQQYQQEASIVPTFAKLYEAFATLEKELEESLPQFQELLLGLNQEEHPTKEAAATRKRLLDTFGQYDALAKRIRKLPCPPGSSQDRVQMAILSRANLFLQKNMFPLQSLPNPTKRVPKAPQPDSSAQIDPDSELALALQPLLEQEALLESFIEEAKTRRKFEDAKTLQDNLKEIRAEIERMVAAADASVAVGNSIRS